MHFKIIFKKLEYMNAWYEHKLAMPEEHKYERITTDLWAIEILDPRDSLGYPLNSKMGKLCQ